MRLFSCTQKTSHYRLHEAGDFYLPRRVDKLGSKFVEVTAFSWRAPNLLNQFHLAPLQADDGARLWKDDSIICKTHLTSERGPPARNTTRPVSAKARELLSDQANGSPSGFAAPKSGVEFYSGFSRAKLYEGAGKGHFRSCQHPRNPAKSKERGFPSANYLGFYRQVRTGRGGCSGQSHKGCRAMKSARAIPPFVEDMLATRAAAGEGVHLGFFASPASCTHICPQLRLSPCWKSVCMGCGRHVSRKEIEDAVKNSLSCAWQPRAMAR